MPTSVGGQFRVFIRTVYSPNTGVIATSLRDFSWGNFGDIYKKEVVNHFEMFKSDED